MTTTTVRSHTLRPYVPALLNDWRPTHGDDRHMQVEGTLAFVDISGFTRLTERLARKGKVGAEEMSDLLDKTFSSLLDDARREDADLVKWGGDAVLLLFRGADHAIRACRASFDMRATLRTVGRLRTSSGPVTLRMSIGVHSGAFDFYLVGDPIHHRELLVVGQEVSRTAEMESVANAGQVVVSERTASLLPRSAHRIGPQPDTRLLRSRPTSPAPLPRPRPGGSDDAGLAQFLPEVLRRQVLSDAGEAEHRTVAVAFVRFSGTDDLARTRGVAAVADALDACIRNVQQASAEHGVTFFETDIDRDGGKVMLVAGAPRSAGHDEERMLRTVRAIADRAGVLPVRIGVNRGAVFAGDFGPPFRRTYSIKGDAVNLAARVMSKAAPGEVLATTATLLRSPTGFSTELLEPFQVKGKSQPVAAARVGRMEGTQHDRRTTTPFVGRRPELAVLREAMQSAVRGHGSHVEVVGEPGVGKTRLAAQLLSERMHARLLRGTGSAYESSTAYFPFRALLREALQVAPDAPSAAVAQELLRVVERSAPHLSAWTPLLAVPLDVTVPATRETSELAAQFRQVRLEQSVDELLTSLLPEPTVLLLDDAHLMDDASVSLLDHLGRHAGARPWLLLVLRRTGDETVRPDVQVVRPQPLPPAEALEIVRAAAAAPMTRDAAERIIVRSGGNPMFLESLVRTVSRLGSGAELPESVQDLMTSQIDELPPLDRTVLRYAAVLGVVADVTLLEQLLVAHLDGVRLRAHLPALAHVLDRDGPGHVRFRHTLLRDVAYEGLPYRRRRVLHEQVGHALERSVPDPELISEVLSLHFFNAGRFEEAWRYSRSAGLRAREKYAHAEAVVLFERAVESARGCSDLSPVELAAVLESLGDAREAAGRSVVAVEAYRRARRCVATEPVAAANLLFKEARALQRLGRVPLSLRLLTRAMSQLDGQDGAAAAASRSHLATRYSWGRLMQGRHTDALRWATVAARAAEDADDRSTLAHAYNGLHSAHHYAQVPEDVPYGRLALRAYEELADLSGQGHAANNLGVEALDAGRLTEAHEFFRRAGEAFARVGDEANTANAAYNSADVLLRQGRTAEAEPLLVEALASARAVGDEELVGLVLQEIARV